MNDLNAQGEGQTVRIGTRASRLARWQSDWVAEQLTAAGHAVEIVEIRTEGDAQQVGPIEAIGTVGVFTKAIQQALLDGRVDCAVHSLKDLPTAEIAGLRLAAVPRRAPVADALISSVADSIDALPQGARVGTGSYRRRAQLLWKRPDLVLGDLRGNVETRLRKLDEGEHDAILLAEAGLTRLGLAGRITATISPEELLPAPGQGSLGIECRAEDQQTLACLAPLNDRATRAAVTAERAALRRLEGGCLAAMGAWATVHEEEIHLRTVVLDEAGRERLAVDQRGSIEEPTQLGEMVANALLAQGAAKLLVRRGG